MQDHLLEVKYGIPKIAYYVSTGNRDAAKQSLASGDDPNLALPLAAMIGDEYMLKLLLEHGADPNTKEQTLGNTALHLACLRGSVPIVEKLISTGANLDQMNSLGFYPIHFATLMGYGKIMELLITSNCNLSAAKATIAPELNQKINELKSGSEIQISELAGEFLSYINKHNLYVAKLFSAEATADLLSFFTNSLLGLHLSLAQIREIIAQAKRKYLPIYHEQINIKNGSSDSWFEASEVINEMGELVLKLNIFDNGKAILLLADEDNTNDLNLEYLFKFKGVLVKGSPKAKKILSQKNNRTLLENKLKKLEQEKQSNKHKLQEKRLHIDHLKQINRQQAAKRSAARIG